MTATVGHNSKTTFAQGQLRSLIERIERLEGERQTIGSDIKEVFAEAKANGFDTKIMRKVLALRKKEASEREEEQALIDLYCGALGMQPDLFDEPTLTPEEEGEHRGRAGEPPVTYTDPDEMQAHLNGWNKGNKARLEEAQG